MNTRSTIELICDAEKSGLKTSLGVALRIKIARAPERNLRPNASHSSRIMEVGKKESRDENGNVTTQAVSTESYMPQNAIFLQQATRTASNAEHLWNRATHLLKTRLGEAAYKTWIAPSQCRSLENNTFTLAVSSDFSRSILLRRHGEAIRECISSMLDGQMVHLQVVVDSTITPEAPTTPQPDLTSNPNPVASKPQSPWAAHQNPGNDPEVALLLERYGDMRGVVFKFPLFQKPCKPTSEGGWGISIGAMINAGKQYTLQRVIWAIRQTQAYPGANDRGKLFYHILRKGLEAGKR